jgi:predicted Rossmann-fold nucleotide-binding protein
MSDLQDGKPASAGRICVFCGSSVGSNPKYLAEAKSLGLRIAGGGWGLVYGGTSIGLMGATADAALSGGAQVIGVTSPGPAGPRDCSPGFDEAVPRRKHARAQGSHGVFVGCFHCAARRLRNA